MSFPLRKSGISYCTATALLFTAVRRGEGKRGEGRGGEGRGGERRGGRGGERSYNVHIHSEYAHLHSATSKACTS